MPLRALIKRITPPRILNRLRTVRDNRYASHAARAAQERTARIRDVFEAAPSDPVWLDYDMLSELQRVYPAVPDIVRTTTVQRGKENADELEHLPIRGIKRTLELGCAEAMTSYNLSQRGYSATGVDLEMWQIPQCVLNNIRYVRCDAADLKIDSNSFDLVFSFNAFEHFSDPRSVLNEAARILRPGGYIYLSFGPLYMAPWGLHAYRSINVPYCQHLFEPDTLNRLIRLNGLMDINFEQLNYWTVDDFRALWDDVPLHRIFYRENYDLDHLDLIDRFPSCFRSKTDHFDNFVISAIQVLFRRN